MSYKTILVHLDAGERRRARLALAVALAEKYDAHLTGVFALPALDPPFDPAVAPVWLDAMLDERRAAADAAAREFTNRAGSVDTEWHAALGEGLSALARHAACADLVIAGQPGPDGDGVAPGFSERLVMSIGRPVLYVPRSGRFERCGTRVLVAWNRSREAARALADAIPFLQRSVSAEVVTFGDKAQPDPEISPYLERHGARAGVLAEKPAADAGAAILARAALEQADLVVMGAYGHARVRELVLGGATREVFKSMGVPTLMSR
jgi:nucleotide-binding universal stress UspA family protein